MKGKIEEVSNGACNEMFRNESKKENQLADSSRIESIFGLSQGIIGSLMCAFSRSEHIDTCQGQVSQLVSCLFA